MLKEISYRAPDQLKKEVEKKQKVTTLFLKKLGRKKPADLDRKVLELHDSGFSMFDCLNCANCCRSLGPRLTGPDIERLAKYLKMKITLFSDEYVKTDEEGDLIFKNNPCPFLMSDNFCSVYESRPKACREYPHTDRKRFYQILELTHKNCETCPVVFEIIDELRVIYQDRI